MPLERKAWLEKLVFVRLAVNRLHLSPAKAGWDSLGDVIPGLRSLRSLHPGLNSSVGSADSLKAYLFGVRRLVAAFESADK